MTYIIQNLIQCQMLRLCCPFDGFSLHVRILWEGLTNNTPPALFFKWIAHAHKFRQNQSIVAQQGKTTVSEHSLTSQGCKEIPPPHPHLTSISPTHPPTLLPIPFLLKTSIFIRQMEETDHSTFLSTRPLGKTWQVIRWTGASTWLRLHWCEGETGSVCRWNGVNVQVKQGQCAGETAPVSDKGTDCHVCKKKCTCIW